MKITITKSKTVTDFFKQIVKIENPATRHVQRCWNLIFSLCERHLEQSGNINYIDISQIAEAGSYRLDIEEEKYPHLASYLNQSAKPDRSQAIRDLISSLLKNIAISEDAIHFDDYRTNFSDIRKSEASEKVNEEIPKTPTVSPSLSGPRGPKISMAARNTEEKIDEKNDEKNDGNLPLDPNDPDLDDFMNLIDY